MQNQKIILLRQGYGGQSKLKIFFLAIILFAVFGSVEKSQAATYNMPNDCANLQVCFAIMSGGDTLEIEDGTYTGANNVINSSNYPPDGSEGSYTIIKAKNNGEVLFDGEDIRNVFNLYGTSSANQRKYIQFEGLEWANNNFIGASGLVELVYTDHIKFIRCGAFDAHDGEDGHVFSTYISQYILFEECYAYGAGDYNFTAGRDSEKIVFRRCVARKDRHLGWDQAYGFVAYGAREVEFQNCIFIDSDQQEFYIGTSENEIQPYAWFFRYADQGFELSDVNYKGSISLANSGGGIAGSGTTENTSVLFENCIHWDGTRGNRTRYNGADVSHCLLGNVSGSGTWNRGMYFEANQNKITNSIVINIFEDVGILGGDGNNYNALYGNYQNYSGVSPGVNDYSLENENEINPLSNSLFYLPRIEDGSDLSGVASDGEDIGVNIQYKIGESETLWGETGWNNVTEESLWPFPNEDLIKEKMAAYSYDDGSGGDPEIIGSRGFAASGNGLYGGPITLTSYIWEYLGNECPAEICDYSSDTTPPSAPSGLNVD